jgi:hypothetical protein
VPGPFAEEIGHWDQTEQRRSGGGVRLHADLTILVQLGSALANARTIDQATAA